jgi:methyl-accepting chemotaxis protein
MWRNRRLQTKLLSVFVGIGLLAVLVTGWQGYYSAKRALEQASFNALTAIREVKKRQIEAYFAQLRHQIVAFAENDMIIEAMQQFQAAFYQVPHDLPATNAPLADSASALHAFYRNVFLDRLMTANETLSVDIQRYLPHDDITTMLQSAYIAQNPHPLGEKDRLLSVEDGSAYSRVHARYHRLLQSYLGKFGYYDIFLIDATTGHVVYTVFKEVDFAANLLTGPLQETTLGQVFRAVRQAPNGFVTLVDFAPYLPSYNAPAAFMATPIFAGTQRLGVLAIQVPIDTIDAIMTGGRRWKHEGLGDSGETYLVGVDYTMRSNSRFLLETPEAFWAQVTQRGTAPDVWRHCRGAHRPRLLRTIGACRC